MPCLDRYCRELELMIVKDNPVMLAATRGEHRGEDRARWEIAIMAFIFGILYVGVGLLVS